VSRFQREAEVLASLNHPNIAAIYDVQEANDIRFLVLELVEGETLAERIARGPIPVEEALDIGTHICEALEAAHEKGIIHRDLKPANVKITPEQKVKVLDFGLAKAMNGTSPNPALSNSPTVLSSGTVGGTIVGTAAYMSPEQARGRAADHRTDVFAVGCVLFEMLTGKQAFQGEDVADVLASVMKIDADFSLLPANLNPRLYELLRRCLAKNRKDRWHAIGDVRFELEMIASNPRVVPELVPASPSEPRPFRKYAIPVMVTAIIVGTIAGIAGWKLKPTVPAQVTRFQLAPPDLQNGSPRGVCRAIAISPDGTKLVYTGANG